MTRTKEKKSGPCDVWVTVLGAGVTGLTAAHELVERGFRVRVVEKETLSIPALIDDNGDGSIDPSEPLVDVGGVARTQWCLPPLGASECSFHEMVAARSLGRGEPVDRGDIPFPPSTLPVYVDKKGNPYFKEDQLSNFTKSLKSAKAIQLVLVNYIGKAPHGLDQAGLGSAKKRLKQTLGLFQSTFPQLVDKERTFGDLKIYPPGRQDVELAEEAVSEMEPVVSLVTVYDRSDWMPGEHGYRFFAGFYRHVFDTMYRTPIFDPNLDAFTPRTILDNLRTVRWQVVADAAVHYPVAFEREPPKSVDGILRQYRTIREELGYRPQDILRFALRLTRYATSSSRRRELQYEDLSWWDFLSLKDLESLPAAQPVSELDPEHSWEDDRPPALRFQFGKRFSLALKDAPAALVAMHASHADARTQGNISVQLVMDQFGLHDRTDSTLFAPTSIAWFDNWKTYLEKRGVSFVSGVVDKIKLKNSQLEVELETGPLEAWARDGDPHYIVSALDLVSAAEVTSLLRPHGGVPQQLYKFAGWKWAGSDYRNPRLSGDTHPRDRLQTLTGIQFFYTQRVSIADGHIYYVSSPWGLSAISQPQFWMPYGQKNAGEHGFLSNLSVDIGVWRQRFKKNLWPGSTTNDVAVQTPFSMSPEEIAAEVLAQIDAGRGTRGRQVSGPPPRYFHLDDYIQLAYNAGKLVPVRNHAPLVMSSVSDWKNRAKGEPFSPNHPLSRGRIPGDGRYYADAHGHANARWMHDDGGYLVHFDRLVFAGPHMRTFTRMTTMEAANESARHAVNAILDHLSFRYEWAADGPGSRTQSLRVRGSSGSATSDIVVVSSMIVAPGLEEPDLQPDFRPRRRRLLPLSSHADPHNRTTAFGDYCDIWDPEDNEFPDLRFLREIDDQLVEKMTANDVQDLPDGAVRKLPHMFDLLGVDKLPDVIATDEHAEAAIHLIASAFETLLTSYTASGDASTILQALRIRFEDFIRTSLGSPSG